MVVFGGKVVGARTQVEAAVQAEREYEAVFRYGSPITGEREYDAPRVTGAELLSLIQEVEEDGGAVYFYGPTVVLYHPDGGVTEVTLS